MSTETNGVRRVELPIPVPLNNTEIQFNRPAKDALPHPRLAAEIIDTLPFDLNDSLKLWAISQKHLFGGRITFTTSYNAGEDAILKTDKALEDLGLYAARVVFESFLFPPPVKDTFPKQPRIKVVYLTSADPNHEGTIINLAQMELKGLGDEAELERQIQQRLKDIDFLCQNMMRKNDYLRLRPYFFVGTFEDPDEALNVIAKTATSTAEFYPELDQRLRQ